jgi:hypothetical protein
MPYDIGLARNIAASPIHSIFMGFGKPDFGLAGYLRVGCGFIILIIAKLAYRNPQVIPQPRKLAA